MTDPNSLRAGAGYALEAGLYATYRAMTEAADTIDTLRAENERLRTYLSNCQAKLHGQTQYDAAAEIDSLHAAVAESERRADALAKQLAEAQKDAKRYRWLRLCVADEDGARGIPPYMAAGPIGEDAWFLSGADADAAIDAAKEVQNA